MVLVPLKGLDLMVEVEYAVEGVRLVALLEKGQDTSDLEEGESHEEERVRIEFLDFLEALESVDEVFEDDAHLVKSLVDGCIGSDELGVRDPAEVVGYDLHLDVLKLIDLILEGKNDVPLKLHDFHT